MFLRTRRAFYEQPALAQIPFSTTFPLLYMIYVCCLLWDGLFIDCGVIIDAPDNHLSWFLCVINQVKPILHVSTGFVPKLKKISLDEGFYRTIFHLNYDDEEHVSHLKTLTRLSPERKISVFSVYVCIDFDIPHKRLIPLIILSGSLTS